MHYLLAIDQGTSSTRAMLYSLKGQLVSTSRHSLTQFYSHTGWVEHSPEEIWEKTLMSIREVVATVDPHKIIACGLTNQRETTLIWDKKTGRCLSPAIVWQDRRTQDYCKSLTAYAGMIKEKTGLLPDPYFSASKLRWLLQNVPEARKLTEQNRLAFGTVDSFLIWRLTGGNAHLTDVTNASRTLLFNIHTESWDDELLQLFDIPRSILPKVCASDAHFGDIKSDLLGALIPITGVVGDQQAALIGQGCVADGMFKATFGTGGFLFLNTGGKPVMSKYKLLTTIAYRVQGKTVYGLEGSLYQAGTTIKWLRDELKLFSRASDTETLAEGLHGNEGVYLVPSFTGLGAPHWLSTPGAAIIGLARTTNPAHFARAALESVCYQTFDVLSLMREDSGMPLSLLRVDGGMAANQWFLQFLASLCGLTVERPNDLETTALGAAMLAAIGCGAIDSLESLKENWSYEKQYLPLGDKASMDTDYQGWQRALRMVKAGE